MAPANFLGERPARGGRLVALSDAIEPVLEDRFHVPVRARAGGQGTRARRFQTIMTVLLAEPQDPEAGAIPLLRMATLGEDRLGELRRLGSHRARPSDDASRPPLHMFLVC